MPINGVEMSLIFCRNFGPLVLVLALNHFALGTQPTPGEKKVGLHPC